MKLVMTMIVRNEDDIIEDNINFHAQMGVDFFIVMDHLSTDRTTSILKQYESYGCLKRISQTSDTFNQGAWVSQMAQSAYSDYGADWVINNDADEFWIPNTGTLKDVLEELHPSVGKLHVNRLDYHYRPFQAAKYYETLIFREWLCRWTKCCHRGVPDVKVDDGNHNAYSNDFSTKYNQDVHIGERLMIHHYPIRSYERYKAKIAQGGKSIWHTPGLTHETGHHWKNALYKLEDGTFDEHFKTFIYDRSRLMSGLKDGSIVVDDTLQCFFMEKSL